jgi:DNA-binding XRE family transcriptional regulator
MTITTTDAVPGRLMWPWGDGIRCLRSIYQMTVEEFAEKAHTTPEEIVRIEAGARDVDLATGLRIAVALGVDAHGLFWDD